MLVRRMRGVVATHPRFRAVTLPLTPGVAGWAGAAACIAAADVVALATGRETVTAAAHRAVTHPAGRTAVAAVVAAAIAHLIVEPHLRQETTCG